MNEMSKLAKIKKIIEDHPGRENAILSTEIAELIGVDPGPSSITIRNLVTKTMKKLHVPIGSGRGYYLITNPDDLNKNIEQVEKRLRNITDRKKDLWHSYWAYHKDQDIGSFLAQDEEDEEEEEFDIDL